MGVPRLAIYMKKKFPKHLISYRGGEKIKQAIDNLYLDANGVAHQAAQIVEGYGLTDGSINKELHELGKYSELSQSERTNAIYELTWSRLKQIVDMVKPKHMVYIAFDGTAPRAKQNQQRQRRFVASNLRTENMHTFDSSHITAGTDFLYNFSQHLNLNIRREVQTRWKHLDIVYSPSTVPGEGEHKIMDYMRDNRCAPDTKHCLYGPDGDLIMLALATRFNYFYLLRDDHWNQGDYFFLQMSEIKNELAYNMGFRVLDDHPALSRDIINDFILMGFFVGNDFLPKIPMFEYLENGIECMVRIYTSLQEDSRKKDKKFIWKLSHNGNILWNNLRYFILKLSNHEANYLEEQLYTSCNDSKFEKKILHKNSYTDIKDNKLHLNYKNFCQDYDHSKLAGKNRDICLEYLKGMKWIFEYYLKGVPSWTWSYKYHYAPLLNHFTQVTPKEWDLVRDYVFDKSQPIDPYLQLLCVLSKNSFNILPKSIQNLPTSEQLEEYFPDDFEIDYEGKHQDWQGVALVPFMDITKISAVYEQTISEKEKESGRNKSDITRLFYFDEEKTPTIYRNKMGKVSNNQVNTVEL